MQTREIEHVTHGQAATDGAGVRLTRLLTQELQQRLDPFLMLDAFGTDNPDDYIAGFPDHPHRGFETITYMLAGKMRHRDSRGNEGLLGPGDLQWMTAGRGIVHSEMPEQVEGRMAGYQLWLNLAAQDKMSAPRYQDIPAEQIPGEQLENQAVVRVLAGSFVCVDEAGAVRVSRQGAVTRDRTEPNCFDVTFLADATLRMQVPDSHNAFLVSVQGNAMVGTVGAPLGDGAMAILGAGNVISFSGAPGTRVLVVSGKPLNEPIVQYGPFVMNSRAQIIEAIDDMKNGSLA